VKPESQTSFELGFMGFAVVAVHHCPGFAPKMQPPWEVAAVLHLFPIV
jgi:hypothetical protein